MTSWSFQSEAKDTDYIFKFVIFKLIYKKLGAICLYIRVSVSKSDAKLRVCPLN